METRPFGHTGHRSTLAVFGAAILDKIEQTIADRAIELALSYGVNSVDTAPAYGPSEQLLGNWIERHAQAAEIGYLPPFFLSTKNHERSSAPALALMEKSFERLKVEVIDLYQFHSVTTLEDLDQITSKGGALEVFEAAQRQGRIRFIGITGHGPSVPPVFLEALKRIDLDSILLSVNPRLWADPVYRESAEMLLAECRRRQIAVMAINVTAKGNWGSRKPTFYSWYEPFQRTAEIQEFVNFALSLDVTAYATIADLTLLLPNLQACENFQRMDAEQRQLLIDRSRQNEALGFFA